MPSEDRRRVLVWLAKPPFDDPIAFAQQPKFSYENWFAEGRALPGGVQILVELLAEEVLASPSGRGPRIAYGLGWVGDQRAAKELIRVLSSKDAVLRGEAAAALGRLGVTEAFGQLLNLLGDEREDASVRASAAIAIGQLGQPGAREALEKAKQSQDSFIASAATEGLRLMGVRPVRP